MIHATRSVLVAFHRLATRGDKTQEFNIYLNVMAGDLLVLQRFVWTAPGVL